MTYRDDEHSAASNPPHAMIGGPRTQDALVPQSNGMPPANIYPVNNLPPAQDVLRGGMDVNWFVNCLRRRWMLAICMGMVISVATAGILWILFPESSSAIALFNVSSHKPTLVFNEYQGNEIREFEILQKTQLAYLKSHFVLGASIRDQAIATLGALAGESDPVQWLMDNLEVAFAQNSEILSIGLSGDEDAEDLRKLVDAVAEAYLNEVVFSERQRQNVIRDALAKSLNKLSDEISTKMEQYNALAKELNISADPRQRDPESELLIRDISEMTRSRGELEGQLQQARIDFLILQQRLKDPAMVDAMVDEQLKSDPNYEQMMSQLMQLQSTIASLGSVQKSRSRESDRINKQVNAINQQMAQYKANMKSQIMGEQKNQPNRELQALTKEYQIRLGILSSRLQELDKSVTAKNEKLIKKNDRSVDLQTRGADIEQLQGIAKDMSVKLQSFDVEDSAPPRIRKLQEATVTSDINSTTRYAITGLGGIAAFALTCFGISYLEFRNRHLNGPDQMDEGLGIRVVGTLPSLTGRKMLDPDHPVVAQLTESIDSVRTQLMHDSTSKRRQVVLVTSAATKEGRTTVASQLAASLARAGRRTLLVDGDVRSPNLHLMFDVPLEDGLSEVLRAEIDVADIIRPTHAEGLWLLTAGYCDIHAIQALATEQMQPVFEKLRAEYDFIIIDGAPVLGMSDALIFGQYCDGAILSVRRDFSQMPKINESACLLQSVGIRLIGCVVNGVPVTSDDRVTQLRLIAPKSERQLQSA